MVIDVFKEFELFIAFCFKTTGLSSEDNEYIENIDKIQESFFKLFNYIANNMEINTFDDKEKQLAYERVKVYNKLIDCKSKPLSKFATACVNINTAIVNK